MLTGFPDSFASVANDTVGNPVRPEISALAAPELRFASHGGSTAPAGARRQPGRARDQRTACRTRAGQLADRHAFDIRHQCGEKMHDETERAYADGRHRRTRRALHPDMAEAYAWADLVIGRAGALTIAELCAAGVGSILVPFPTAVDDHQATNAEFLSQHGGGWLVPAGRAAGKQPGETPCSTWHRIRERTACRWPKPRALRRIPAARPSSVADIIIQETAHR